MELITSRSNPLLAHMRKLLKNRSYRRTCSEGISDGVKLLEEAIRCRAPLTAVVLTEDVACPVLPEGVRCVQVPKDVMASLSPMKAPQGALFTFRLPDLTAPEQLTGDRYLVLDGVPGPRQRGHHLADGGRPLRPTDYCSPTPVPTRSAGRPSAPPWARPSGCLCGR